MYVRPALQWGGGRGYTGKEEGHADLKPGMVEGGGAEAEGRGGPSAAMVPISKSPPDQVPTETHSQQTACATD